ncbi:hypothetical protein NL108_013495 [Boleophthalmus pectinirostris]|uniref:uncharacterized protein misp n=1 Tax=Boleophthalmus pectinirostris TaxID=150288 RepID=UPI00242F088B|nr:uncharacterized protein misp [Boleophthalmus pectinirostris]KAJ0065582.1 hypothetical protein NL108_013495 [Boleophthalmus pectinirostris]
MDDTSRLIEGFSMSFSHVRPKPKPTIDSDAIDEEQINFNAARKQFVQMEQNKIDPIIRPRKIQVKTSPKLKPDAAVLREEIKREELVFKPSVEDSVDAEVKDDRSSSHSRQSSYMEESDGLSLNVSYSSIDVLAHEQNQTGNNTFQFNVEPETPIEREIRITQEREENLRRSRGLQSSVSEMVEIKTKRLQLLTPLTPSRVKDKGKASSIFQEIQRKEEAIKQDAAAQELAGRSLERANSYDVLHSNANEDRASFIFQERKGEAINQDGVTRGFPGPKRERANSYDILQPKAHTNESNGTNASEQKAKLDVVDYALQKQNYTGQDGSKTDDRQSYTKQVQGYAEPYVPGERRVERYSYTKQSDQVLARNGELEGFKSFEERWQTQNGDKMENGFKSVSTERSEDVFPLSCCPHKHPEDSDPTRPEQTPAWRDSLERTTGLHNRGQGGSLLIERDIEEALRREKELREQREAQVRQMYSLQTLVEQSDRMAAPQFIKRDIEEALRREQELSEQREIRGKQVYSPQTLVQQADKMAATQFYPQIRTGKEESRVHTYSRPSLGGPQPWSPAPQTSQTPLTPFRNVTQTTAPHTPQNPSPLVVRVPLPVRGLTQTLLQDFEERRIKLKLDESAYAGIQPVDSVNNEVVESTRVVRHKNQRALQWEAGLFANQQDQ